MDFTLTDEQARVLGVLIEKEATTPDAYPLSLNAVTTAANQKSNRDPVMDLSESQTQIAIDGLLGHTLVTEQAAGRVLRYSHRLSSRLFGTLEFDEPERALLAVLMLRGPQTSGELRARCGRLHPFADTAAVESVLRTLGRREDGPFVVELAKEPGRRETRFAHLLCGEVDGNVPKGPAGDAPVGNTLPGAPQDALQNEVAELRARIEALEARLDELNA